MIRMTDEPTAVTLDLDQAELALNPTRTRVWAPIGMPWEVETPGNNKKQPIFGAVNTKTGQTHFALKAHKRSQDLQEFLDREVIPRYHEAEFLFITADGSSIYTSKSTKQWLKTHPQVIFVPLPSYAPKLNLQEHVWRWMRAAVTHNHFFGTFAALIEAAQRFFTKLANRRQEVLQHIGRAFDGMIEHQLAALP
jgi:DDE superfamily endonuclease